MGFQLNLLPYQLKFGKEKEWGIVGKGKGILAFSFTVAV
jgi:hypothetical protein